MALEPSLIHIQNQPRMAYEAVYRRERPDQYDIGLAASVDTLPEYAIRGWLCIYYTFKHLNRFICDKYLAVLGKILSKATAPC